MTVYKKYRKGNIVRGKVSGITNYGIFVKIDENYTGLIHISSISEKFVKDPNNYAKVDDVINVEILDIDENKSRMNLSIKNIRYKDTKLSRNRIIETKHGFETLKNKSVCLLAEHFDLLYELARQSDDEGKSVS